LIAATIASADRFGSICSIETKPLNY